MTKQTTSIGTFSVSLAVKDLARSRAFYETLGFTRFAGDGNRWLILRNGNATIGLHQGMFEKNILTFNPGWDADARPLEEFTDVRELQRRFRAAGIEPVSPTDDSTSGPANFVIVDPDGNPVLIDQHV